MTPECKIQLSRVLGRWAEGLTQQQVVLLLFVPTEGLIFVCVTKRSGTEGTRSLAFVIFSFVSVAGSRGQGRMFSEIEECHLFYSPLLYAPFRLEKSLFGLERGEGLGLGEECHVFARVLNLAPSFVRSPLAASTAWSSPHALLRLFFVLLVGLKLEIERRLLFKCQQRGAGREDRPEKCSGADSWHFRNGKWNPVPSGVRF